MSTLKEIARRAGVSVMTVSNVLNGRTRNLRRDAAARAEKIRQIADQLGYRFNAGARTMRSGSVRCIAFVADTVGGHIALPGLQEGAYLALTAQQWQLTLGSLTGEQLASAPDLPGVLRQWSVDGMLIHPLGELRQTMDPLLRRYRLPVVYLNTLAATDCVSPDDTGNARALTTHLLALGHRRIVYLDLFATAHYSTQARQEGYMSAMAAAKLSPRAVVAPIPRSEWPQRISALLRVPQPPTAVVTCEPPAAEAVCHVAGQLGFSIPAQLSVATFSGRDCYVGGHIPLTHLHTNMAEIGRRGALMLLEKIARPRRALPAEVCAGVLREGKTCAPMSGR